MNYQETLDFLFNRLQSFHNDGAKAYKPGLEKAFKLSAAFKNPHKALKVIHVAGTNGKGSVSHSLASVLMTAGMKVGLYTSPHLIDFRERIRIDGEPIPQKEVVAFIEKYRSFNLAVDPSFFELTTIMAFDWFAKNQVDIAVIEVGLGGRLDTTNIVNPILSIITNISFDHTNLLGSTLKEIASEKAGIIKNGIPVVIGRRNPETDKVFENAADSTVVFAEDKKMFVSFELKNSEIIYKGTAWGDIKNCLTGECQPENMQTVLTTLKNLEEREIIKIDNHILNEALSNTCSKTGLMGRWMKINDHPTTITDTAHNVDGWRFIIPRLQNHLPKPLHIVIGFVNDKDFTTILSMLPKEAFYYFVQPSVNRAASSARLAKSACEAGRIGEVYNSVVEGYEAACLIAEKQRDAMIYVGGSTFVVADLLTSTFYHKFAK